MKKISIQRLFNIIVAIFVTVVAVVYLSFSIFVFTPAYERGNREVHNTILSTGDSIEAQFRIMSNIASSLAYNADVQTYIQLENAYEPISSTLEGSDTSESALILLKV